MGRDAKKISISGHSEKWHRDECYKTYAMDFWFVPSDSVCFD